MSDILDYVGDILHYVSDILDYVSDILYNVSDILDYGGDILYYVDDYSQAVRFSAGTHRNGVPEPYCKIIYLFVNSLA